MKKKPRVRPVRISGLKTKFVISMRGDRESEGEVVDYGRARLKKVRKKSRARAKPKEVTDDHQVD